MIFRWSFVLVFSLPQWQLISRDDISVVICARILITSVAANIKRWYFGRYLCSYSHYLSGSFIGDEMIIVITIGRYFDRLFIILCCGLEVRTECPVAALLTFRTTVTASWTSWVRVPYTTVTASWTSSVRVPYTTVTASWTSSVRVPYTTVTASWTSSVRVPCDRRC